MAIKSSMGKKLVAQFHSCDQVSEWAKQRAPYSSVNSATRAVSIPNQTSLPRVISKLVPYESLAFIYLVRSMI
jgi:hypothetical protein